MRHRWLFDAEVYGVIPNAGTSAATVFSEAFQLAHGSPNLEGILAGKCHIILSGGTALKVELQHSFAEMGLSDQIEIDGDFSCAFFILHFYKSHSVSFLL